MYPGTCQGPCLHVKPWSIYSLEPAFCCQMLYWSLCTIFFCISQLNFCFLFKKIVILSPDQKWGIVTWQNNVFPSLNEYCCTLNTFCNINMLDGIHYLKCFSRNVSGVESTPRLEVGFVVRTTVLFLFLVVLPWSGFDLVMARLLEIRTLRRLSEIFKISLGLPT